VPSGRSSGTDGQLGGVGLRELAPRRVEALELGQLPQPERRLQVEHVVLPARLEHVVVRHAAAAEAIPGVLADAVEAQDAQPVGERGVVAHDHAALAGGDVLDRMEAEDGRVAARADLDAPVDGAQRVRRVLDDPEAVPHRQRPQRGHVGRLAGEVHRDQRARGGRDPARDVGGVDAQRLGVDVGEDRARTAQLDDVGRRRPGEGRHDDLVARPQPERGHGQVQARGRGVHGDRLAHAEPLAESGLEALDLRPARDPARAQRVDHLGDLVVLDRRAREGQWQLAPRGSTHRTSGCLHATSSSARRPG
jgi:hypothetical protein